MRENISQVERCLISQPGYFLGEDFFFADYQDWQVKIYTSFMMLKQREGKSSVWETIRQW
jgi:hypothetical protein